ncbi:hypothetical protein D5W64_12665 [Salmonella enterica subsp. enterica serovar Saintpaul]|nr:hypothetical protein [Salmonella enterica subsp. enterica serovar Saintpaul]
MAKQKKPRNKTYAPLRARVKHVQTILNHAISKFYMIGDMNHVPTSFHLSDVQLHLKPADAVIAYQEVAKFLYGENRPWGVGIYHFFDIEGSIDVVPAVIQMDDTNLREVALAIEDHIASTKAAIIESDDCYTEDSHIFYGYYINYGDNLSWDAMEGDIIEAFMKVNNDLSDIKPEVVKCTPDLVLEALRNEKFTPANTMALKTEMKEQVSV